MSTTEAVKAILRMLPVGKAVGLDGVSSRFLRELAIELSTPLASLLNHSVHKGEVPVCFKVVHICPVPKGVGNPSDVCHDRPISLLSHLDKVLYLNICLTISVIITFLHLGDPTIYQLTFLYSRLSLSRTPRDSMKHFEISVLRHIRFAELRKTINRTTTFNRMNM